MLEEIRTALRKTLHLTSKLLLLCSTWNSAEEGNSQMKELSNKREGIITGTSEPALPGCKCQQTKKSARCRMRRASLYCHATPGFQINPHHQWYSNGLSKHLVSQNTAQPEQICLLNSNFQLMVYPQVVISNRPLKTPQNLLISLHIPVLYDKVIEAANLLTRIVLVWPRFRGREGKEILPCFPKEAGKTTKSIWKDQHKFSFLLLTAVTNTLWKSRNYKTQITRKTLNL